MNSNHKPIALLIMAAGAGSRFGGKKQLADINGQSLLQRQLQNYQQLEQLEQLVPYWLFGAYGEDCVAELSKLTNSCAYSVDKVNNKTQAYYLINPNWSNGLGSNIAFAIKQLEGELDKYSAVMITLLDQPELTRHDYLTLIQQHRAKPSQIICCQYGKKPSTKLGVPAIFPISCYPKLTKLTGDTGAKALLQQSKNLTSLAIANALFDIDSQQDLTHYLSRINTHGEQTCLN